MPDSVSINLAFAVNKRTAAEQLTDASEREREARTNEYRRFDSDVRRVLTTTTSELVFKYRYVFSSRIIRI